MLCLEIYCHQEVGGIGSPSSLATPGKMVKLPGMQRWGRDLHKLPDDHGDDFTMHNQGQQIWTCHMAVYKQTPSWISSREREEFAPCNKATAHPEGFNKAWNVKDSTREHGPDPSRPTTPSPDDR